jgi:hypothetical protein
MNGRKRTRIVLGGLLVIASACKDEASEPAAAAPAADGAPAAPSADGPRPDAPAKVETPPAEPPPSGHAVAKVGSRLFFSSTGDAGFELPSVGVGPRAGAGMTVNVVGEQDGRLVVETLVTEPAEHHCATTIDGLTDFRLRLYLAADELQTVLTEELEHELGDGTKIRLARGVPVPAGRAALAVRGTTVQVPVPVERLGRFYEPGQPFASEGGQGKLYAFGGHALTYGGQTLDESDLYHDGGHLVSFGSTPKGSDALITVRNPCLEVTALVSNERLHASEGTGHFLASPYGSAFAAGGDGEDVGGGLTMKEVEEAYGVGGLGWVGRAGGKPSYEVKAGVAITWADGLPAGQVTADHRFTAAPHDEGGRTCFDIALVVGQSSTVTLCFTPGDVEEIAPSAGPGLGGTDKLAKVHQDAVTATVKGSIDGDVVRRIVRAHINEVRYCYIQGLARNPKLEGKVSIQFTITPLGDVSVATVAKTTLEDVNVGSCIAMAVERWQFSKPSDGGNVVVTYPFVMEPG